MDMQVVIIDCGSGLCKAGVASNDYPTLTNDTVVGYENKSHITGVSDKRYYGQEALEQKMIQLSFPINHGIIEDFNKMEEYLTYIFSRLPVKPEESVILLTETLSNRKVNREKITEIIFEKFGFYLAKDAILTLLGTERTTGIVLHSRHGVKYSVTVNEGNVAPNTLRQMDIAGGRDAPVPVLTGELGPSRTGYPIRLGTESFDL
ncbi:unnamed protein product [Rotaria sordida]|uniref:Actin n=1 Tax=Rotaria sordida TaxID=392033 RepID=A0A813MGK7_9BILA|nr:unnamed protein product [Rotaria sordida]CAF0760523.1 unnamed protein product [Rotaria sordida]